MKSLTLKHNRTSIYLAPFLANCSILREVMIKYKDHMKYYVNSNSGKNNSILLIADDVVPIFSLEKSVFISDIKCIKGKFHITCELPEEISVQSFLESKYSQICSNVGKMFFHDEATIRVMISDNELKEKLIDSLMAEDNALERIRLEIAMKELDSLVNEEEEYVLC